MAVLEHMKGKLEVPSYEWRRIYKVTLTLMYVIESDCHGISFKDSASESTIRLEK